MSSSSTVQNARDHTLFRQFPLTGSAVLSDGTEVPTPYHIYDGSILLIGGSADYERVSALVSGEGLTPIQTKSGRALMAVWVCEFTQASLGPHCELQFSLLVTSKPTAPVDDHPLRLLELVAFHDNVLVMCHGLWNDSDTVVRYNRELLDLNARLASATIDDKPATTNFSFTVDGQPLISGQIQQVARQPFGPIVSMLGAFGLSHFFQAASAPSQTMRIVNTLSDSAPTHVVAETHTKSDVQVTRLFDPSHDRLKISASPYDALDFTPQFVSSLRQCKFVYLNPQPLDVD